MDNNVCDSYVDIQILSMMESDSEIERNSSQKEFKDISVVQILRSESASDQRNTYRVQQQSHHLI